MNENNNFFLKNLGAIIGAIVGLVLACTGFYRYVVAIIALVLGAYIGKRIQYNKEELKEKAKDLIDKL